VPLFVAIILTLTALLPRPLRDSSPPPETRAMAAIRTIHTAEAQFFSQYGHYAVTLRELAPLIGDRSAAGVGTDYRLTLAAKPGGYTVSAVPQILHGGSRTLFSDQTMVLHEHYGPGPARSPK
jgi:hypothetical protein